MCSHEQARWKMKGRDNYVTHLDINHFLCSRNVMTGHSIKMNRSVNSSTEFYYGNT